MTGYLPNAVIEELGKSLKKKSEKTLNMAVRFDNIFYPILKFSEKLLGMFAGLGGGSPAAWWFSILMITPLLGSFITEPAAITIAALLLANQFYKYKPSSTFA